MKYLKIVLILFILVGFEDYPLFARDKKSIAPEDILNMSIEEMLNVKIITAGKKEERIADIPASAVIITRKDIEKYGYMSLEEILENVPSMYVIDDLGAYRKTYGVRGFYSGTPRNIIFLVNGVSQAEGVFDFNVMANFNIPVEAIDRIEVVRGPMSVMYGQGAFFGAINIITNDSYDGTSLASVSYGNMAERAVAKISETEGEFKYSLSAGYSATDGPDQDWDKMVTDMSALTFWGINSSNNTTKERLERDSKNFIFSGKYKHFYTDMMFNQSTDEAAIFRPAVSEGSAYNRDSAKIAVGYENQISEAVRIDTKMIYHHFSFDLDWDITSAVFTGSDAGETSGEADMYEFEANSFINVTDDFLVTTGLYYKMTKDPEFHADVNIFNLIYDDTTTDDIELLAAFTQMNYLLNEKFRLVGGLRAEKLLGYTMIHDNKPGQPANTLTQREYDEDDIDLIPSLAAIYSYNDQNVFKFLYSQAIARPSFFQNRDQFVSGRPNLEPEEIETFELNYMTVPSSKITANLSVFHNTLDRLIVRNNSLVGNQLVQYSSNGGKLVTNGAELSILTNPCEKFHADFSLTYQDTEDQRDGYGHIEVAYSPHLLGYAKLSYDFTGTISFALTGTYVDEMETEWNAALNGGAGGRIGQSVDGHFLLGANLRFNDLFDKGVYLNIRGSNILNNEYLYPTYVNNTWADKGTLGDPFEILVTMGVKF